MVVLLAAVLAAGCHNGPVTPKPNWAEAIPCDEIPNFHRVNEGLYRGAQPTREGFRRLADMGVRTVVNLRRFHSERATVEEMGMGYARIPFWAIGTRKEDQAVEFLRIMSDPSRRPVFVHCGWGGDRTGTMVAIYRIVFDGWTREEAIAEMVAPRFEYHVIWEDLTDFLERTDVDDIRRRAGLTAPVTDGVAGDGRGEVRPVGSM